MNDSIQKNSNISTELCEKVFVSTQDFREKATEKDYIQLDNYIKALKNKSEGFPCTIYKFSYSSAANLLKEQSRKTEQIKEEFSISKDTLPPGEYASRTITIKKGTLDKLDHFCEKYNFYSKQSIITVLLEEVLKLYE